MDKFPGAFVCSGGRIQVFVLLQGLNEILVLVLVSSFRVGNFFAQRAGARGDFERPECGVQLPLSQNPRLRFPIQGFQLISGHVIFPGEVGNHGVGGLPFAEALRIGLRLANVSFIHALQIRPYVTAPVNVMAGGQLHFGFHVINTIKKFSRHIRVKAPGVDGGFAQRQHGGFVAIPARAQSPAHFRPRSGTIHLRGQGPVKPDAHFVDAGIRPATPTSCGKAPAESRAAGSTLAVRDFRAAARCL